MQHSEVIALINQHYGIAGTCEPLLGERDLNFKVDSESGKYIFKVQQRDEASFIDLQSRLLARLDESDATVPNVIRTKDNALSFELPDGRVCRLLSWVEGQLWSDLETHDESLLSSLGTAVATLDSALAHWDFSDDVATLDRPFGWNVMQAKNLLPSLDLIRNEEIRATVRTIVNNFVNNTLPKVAELDEQVIHNDGNDNNIIVRDNQVAALIDFGDIILAPRICGLAVACAYAMTELDDPVLSIVAIVRGYHKAAPLTENELEVLFDLITVRVATSIAMAAIQSASQPDNDYLNISQAHFNKLITVLAATSPELSHFRFRTACGYEAVPTSRAVRQYLMSGRATTGDVVFPPLNETPKVWFDWSINNTGAPQTSEEIDTAMREAGALLAIGHYCEDRDVYKGDAYEVAGENRRTTHLGVDLFAPAGTPVYAALDGVVEMFNDNFAPLDYGPVIILRHETDEGIPFWTLYGHLSRPSLVPLFVGKEIAAGEQIATMGEEFENVGWAPHTHFQLLTSLCGMGIDIYGVAPLNELPMWRSISPNPNLCLKISEGTDAHAHLRKKELINERSVVLSRALSLNFASPLEITRGEGAYLYEPNGRNYLDLVNNVAHVGHCHPRVVDAGQRQMAMLNTNTRYLNQNAIEFARALAGTMPDPLSVVFFVNSGSEANDLALRLARNHTQAHGMLVLDQAYHGHLSSIIDISPYKFAGRGGQGRPDFVRVVPTPDAYKGIHRGPQAGVEYARELEAQLADLGQPLCAFISESIVSTAGQITLADGFLKQAYDIVHAAGGLCIADEVQIGMGRVGEHFWGFELHGVTPDIVTIGKPLGNGHPLAAVVTTPEIAQSFLTGMEYFNTFGGNPVSAAIGQSVLDVIADQHLQANARTMGNYLMSNVRDMAKEFEFIGDVRGSGLFIGVEFVTDRDSQNPATEMTSNLLEFARERGVFLSSDGPANNVLKIKPPLVINQSDIDLFLSVLADGLRVARS